VRRRALPGLLAACLLAAPGAAAEVTEERLANGLTLSVRENPVAPVVAVSLLVKMGTRWEDPASAGISNFVHAVMVKGTARRSGSELAEAVAALGGKISATGDMDHSEIRASALARFWRELLALVAELALEPKLQPAEVDVERGFLLSRIQKRRDNAPARAFDELYAALYAPHPYALPVLGTPESLARIDHAAIVAAYREGYRPARMILAVSGQVGAPEVLVEARRLFGGLPGGAAPAEPASPRPAGAGRRVEIEMPAQQSQILGGGMAGRLFVELRDKRGLAYTATSYYDPVRGPGALVLYLGTAPENAARAEEALRREVERIQREAIGAEELRRAKGYLLGRYVMDRRTNERQAWYLAFYELEGQGRDYPARYRGAVEAVTASDVQRVARQYLSTVTTVILGPR